MNWFEGNVAEAVTLSKAKNAIFVVFVEGKDEFTAKLMGFLSEEKVRSKLQSDNFVAIKIESESEAYMQFASIYRVVPVPSIFFIGNTGTPIEIGTGIIETVDELERKIDNVLAALGKSTPTMSASSSFIAGEQQVVHTSHEQPTTSKNALAEPPVSQPADVEIVCDGDVCHKNTKKAVTSEPPSAIGAVDTAQMLNQKRRERIELENKAEKEHELRRRRDGKETQHMQQWQKEQEHKDLKEKIRRERLEEQKARERICAQIAADRAERANKFVAPVVKSGTSAPPVQHSSSGGSNEVRLQFRFANGENKTHSFSGDDTLAMVRTFVQTELLVGKGIRDYLLATTYPKRELTVAQDEQTLVELGLYPSAVILVIVKDTGRGPGAIIARSGGLVNMLSMLFWALLSPVMAIYGYIRNIKLRGRGGEDAANKRASDEPLPHHEAAKRRNLDRFNAQAGGGGGVSGGGGGVSGGAASTSSEANDGGEKPYRRYGSSNIHRLTDNRKDSDDENATWNGNSTQQQ